MDRLLSAAEHPVLGRLGITATTAAPERDEAILLADLEERVSDEELARLERERLFVWREEFGEPPPGLGSEPT